MSYCACFSIRAPVGNVADLTRRGAAKDPDVLVCTEIHPQSLWRWCIWFYGSIQRCLGPSPTLPLTPTCFSKIQHTHCHIGFPFGMEGGTSRRVSPAGFSIQRPRQHAARRARVVRSALTRLPPGRSIRPRYSPSISTMPAFSGQP